MSADTSEHCRLPNLPGQEEQVKLCIEALQAHAKRSAELILKYRPTIAALSDGPKSSIDQARVPCALIYDLAAILQIDEWREQGVLELLNLELEGFDLDKAALIEKALSDPDEYIRSSWRTGSERHYRVLLAWLGKCAWDGPERIGAEVALSHADKDSLIDVIASFLLENRDRISEQLNIE